MPDSVFTRIVKGELPAHKVYEDEATLAIIPLHPIAKAHVLVIPKLQVDQFFELPEADYAALMRSVKKVAERTAEVFQTKRVGLKVVGLDVPHVHVHVIAFDSQKEYDEHPDESLPPDNDKLALMAERLRFQ